MKPYARPGFTVPNAEKWLAIAARIRTRNKFDRVVFCCMIQNALLRLPPDGGYRMKTEGPVRETSYEERATWGTCPVCGARMRVKLVLA